MYTIRALPKTVSLADIKWIVKTGGESSDNPFAVLKCKKACKTIFTYEGIKEMNRFSQMISEMKEWPQYCIRNTWSKEGDGLGCSVDSYHNLTSYLDVVSMANQT